MYPPSLLDSFIYKASNNHKREDDTKQRRLLAATCKSHSRHTGWNQLYLLSQPIPSYTHHNHANEEGGTGARRRSGRNGGRQERRG